MHAVYLAPLKSFLSSGSFEAMVRRLQVNCVFCLFVFLALAAGKVFAFDVGDSFGFRIKNYSFDQMQDAHEYNQEKFLKDGVRIKILQSNLFGSRPLSDFILHTSGFLTAYQGKIKLGTFAFVEYTDDGELNFFYDYDDDGIIDAVSNVYFIPPWVLFKAKIVRKYPAEFFALCEKIYREFNCEAALNEAEIEKHNLEISKLFNSDDCEAYDVYYSYLIYLTQMHDKNAYKILQSLENFIKVNFKIETVPLLKLFIGESYFNLQQYNIATLQFNKLKNYDANSRLAEFYLACIADIKNNATSERMKFASEFPQMWILQQEQTKPR